jgi:hypothetical protein
MAKNGNDIFGESQERRRYRKKYQLKEAMRKAEQDILALRSTISDYVEIKFQHSNEETSNDATNTNSHVDNLTPKSLGKLYSLNQAILYLQFFSVHFKADRIITFQLPKYWTGNGGIEGTIYEVNNDETRAIEAIELLEIFKTQLREIQELLNSEDKPNYVTNTFTAALSSITYLERAFLDYMEIEISNYYPV